MEGRVLRLNFSCRAELPHGSSLRVTSSNIWGAQIGNGTVKQQNFVSVESDLSDDNEVAVFATSVEMVTSPETYPIWRTKTPVICIVNHSIDGIFRHRYRYLVVTPGAGFTDDYDSKMLTTDFQDGVIDVTEWEDPFLNDQDVDVIKKPNGFDSLPYRTLDIDVSNPNAFGKALFAQKDGQEIIDKFNDGNDESYSAFKAAKQAASRVAKNNMKENVLGVVTPTESEKKRIYLVCYHLPVIISKDEQTGEYSAIFSESIIAKTEKQGVSKVLEAHWLGRVSCKATSEEDQDKIRKVLAPMNCTPIFLAEHTVEAFYFGFCKQVLWPAFHNIDLVDISKSGWGQKKLFDKEGKEPDLSARFPMEFESDWDQSKLDSWWNAFCAVNKVFCDTLLTLVKPSDIVWVHDYHLCLLPKLIHERDVELRGHRNIQIVFFLHIPFPTSQVFRELDKGEQILEGMLHADVVGFHAFDHARHFLNASKRILGLAHQSLAGGLIGVRFRGTKVLVTISNVSIESDVLSEQLETFVVKEGAIQLTNRHANRKIISGIDVAQGLSGVSLKLLAFEKLLTDYPVWRNKVVLIQICLIPGSRKNDEIDTLAHIRFIVKRIHDSFGTDVLSYEEIEGSSVPRDRRLSLWLATDVLLITPIREGMTLLPLEYAYCKKNPNKPGVTITSEFSTIANILNGACRSNPYDTVQAAICLDTALGMSEEEKDSRRQRDIDFVTNSSSGLWTRRVLNDLADVTKANKLENDADENAVCLVELEGVRSQSDMKISSILLDKSSVVKAYNEASSRVLFVDFNGTIVMTEPAGKYLKRDMLGVSNSKPPPVVIKSLIELCSDPKNVVYVVSGDTEQNLENAIGGINNLGLAAGNGGSISDPRKLNYYSKRWRTSELLSNWDSVKRIAIPVLSMYTARANGSYVKVTSSSIGWSYYACDPEWGSLLATHLIDELGQKLQGFDVRLVTLKGVIEIVPRKLNKGIVVKKVLRSHKLPDFILCVGDDISDEKMFTSILAVIAQRHDFKSSNQNPKHTFTVTVGKKVSNASFFVESSQDVADLLVEMSGISLPLRRAMSWDESKDSSMFE